MWFRKQLTDSERHRITRKTRSAHEMQSYHQQADGKLDLTECVTVQDASDVTYRYRYRYPATGVGPSPRTSNILAMCGNNGITYFRQKDQ
ncbi:hypothetical protein V1264_022253 [Littorina saxatilis]|uniref:Uncharacterized protein n=1 Tax=Littorina saxatilis TaxID=31220 RepID=A0AAN9FXE8_9CAEN